MIPARSFALLILLTGASWAAEPVNPRVIQRYKEMLSANPVEGTALDRLWKTYSDSGKAVDLLKEYEGAMSFSGRMVLGHLLRRAERLEEAIAAYRAAGQLEPASPLPHLGLARLHASTGRNPDAAEAWQAAAGLIPAGDPRLAETLLEAGNAWLAAGESEKAAAVWEKTVAAAPQDIVLRERLAQTYLENGLLDPAIPHLEYIVGKGTPKARAEGLKQLARIHQLAGRADEAIACLERAIAAIAPGNYLREELQDELIRSHQRLDRTRELEERWNAYAAKNPRDVTAYLQLLAFHERTGELGKAREWMEKLVALVPKNPGYRWRLARLRLRLDDTKGAAELYDSLLAAESGNSDLVFERAELEMRGPKPEAGAERVAKFIAARPNDETLQGRALQFYEKHHLTEWTERQLRAEARTGSGEKVRALADFLFAQARAEEGEVELKRLVRAKGAVEERAKSLLETAQALKGHGRLQAALESVQTALALNPSKGPLGREGQLLAADLHTALKDPMAARDALEKAVELSQTPAEQGAADQKLFDVLRLGPGGEEARQQFVPGIPTLPMPDAGPELRGQLGVFMEGLARDAVTLGTEDAWLRLARWRSWTRDKGGALEAARKAVEVTPTSVAAHEAQIALASADPASPIAVAYLQKLATIDPANRSKHLQRIAQLKLQSGNLPEARATLEELAVSQPSNLDLLQDLALVRERMHDWPAAVEAWQQIYRSGKSARNREALAPLLRGLEELGRVQPAAEMLLAETNATGDPTLRGSLFDQLLAHCTKHKLLPWLSGEWKKRRLRAEETHFNEVAFSQILKAQGDSSGAFRALREASFSAPDLAAALPELVQEAERHDFTEAVKLQERLLLAQAQPDAGSFLKLAQLQERVLALEDLTSTWDRAVTRFPRESSVLLPAAEFFLDLGNPGRASDLYRRAIEVDPANSKALLARASLELELGRPDTAATALEQLLARVAVSPEEVGLRLPQVKATEGGRLQGAYLTAVRHRQGSPRVEAMRALQQFWVDRPGKQSSASEMRFAAIEHLAGIVRLSGDSKRQKQWLERWAKASVAPGEALWALYHAGEAEAAIEIVEGLMAKDPKNVDNQQAFLWLALQSGQWERLGKWVRDPKRTANDPDFLIVALGQYLQSEGFKALDDAALGHLFPPNATTRIWQAAALYASQAHFGEAARIGQKAFQNAGVRSSSYGQELANWHLSTGQVDHAGEVLQTVASGAGETFDSPVYAALRQRYLLLPKEERAPYVERMEAQIGAARSPVHRALASTLLHGLAGDHNRAKGHLDELLRMRPMVSFESEEQARGATRSWTFLLSVGLQLQAWKLEPLTEHLWSRVLADPALAALEGEGSAAIARDLKLRLFALQTAGLEPVEFDAKVRAYLRTTSADGLLPLGEALENLGAARQALQVYRSAWEQDPRNPQMLRNVLNACRTAQDIKATEAVLRTCVKERLFGTNETLHRDLLSQLADVLDQQGAFTEALELLSESAKEAPQDPRLLQRLAIYQEKTGRTVEAEASWRRLVELDAPNPSFRLSLAALLQKTGRAQEAIQLLGEIRDGPGELRLAELHLECGNVDEVMAICYRAAPAQLPALALRLAPLLVERNQHAKGRGLLKLALERTTDPATALPLRTRLAESFDAVKDRSLLSRELRRIRRLALQNEAQRDGYFGWIQEKSGAFEIEPQVRVELEREWGDGSGRVGAGIALFLLEFPRPADAEGVLTQLLARRDLSLPEVDRLIGACEAAGQKKWLGLVQERGVEMNALDDHRLVAWIRTLHQTQGTEQACAAFDRWSPRLWLSTDSAALGGEMCAELGRLDHAEALFRHAIRHDTFNREPNTRIQYARLKRRKGELAQARTLLVQAFGNPGQRDFRELVEWLAAAGKLDDFEDELPAFALSEQQTILFRQALPQPPEKAQLACPP